MNKFGTSVRNGNQLTGKEAKMKNSPLKSIRKHCLECVGNWYWVKRCEEVNCRFYPYREGRNPRRRGVGNKNAQKNLKHQKSSINR